MRKRALVTGASSETVLPPTVVTFRRSNLCEMKQFSNTDTFLTEESDFGLLTTIGCADIDQNEAERALELLYDRHAKLLVGVAMDNGWAELGVDVEVLLQETFLSVWESAGDFDPSRKHYTVRSEDAVRLWLVRIFKNKFLDALAAIGSRPEFVVTPPDELDELPAIHDDKVKSFARQTARSIAVSAGIELVRKWLATQLPGDRDLLLISAQFIDYETGKCFIPPDELRGLAATLGVVPKTIKVKRARLMRRLKGFLLENQNQ